MSDAWWTETTGGTCSIASPATGRELYNSPGWMIEGKNYGGYNGSLINAGGLLIFPKNDIPGQRDPLPHDLVIYRQEECCEFTINSFVPLSMPIILIVMELGG
jgi:hypothetical protein